MNNKVKDKINKARCSYAHLKPQHLGGWGDYGKFKTSLGYIVRHQLKNKK
jgi:hypothetical protein